MTRKLADAAADAGDDLPIWDTHDNAQSDAPQSSQGQDQPRSESQCKQADKSNDTDKTTVPSILPCPPDVCGRVAIGRRVHFPRRRQPELTIMPVSQATTIICEQAGADAAEAAVVVAQSATTTNATSATPVQPDDASTPTPPPSPTPVLCCKLHEIEPAEPDQPTVLPHHATAFVTTVPLVDHFHRSFSTNLFDVCHYRLLEVILLHHNKRRKLLLSQRLQEMSQLWLPPLQLQLQLQHHQKRHQSLPMSMQMI
jgi:hypothetical protein